MEIEKDKYGFDMFILQKNNKEIYVYIHESVYRSFVGPIPEGKEVYHIDGNKDHNYLENLGLRDVRER